MILTLTHFHGHKLTSFPCVCVSAYTGNSKITERITIERLGDETSKYISTDPSFLKKRQKNFRKRVFKSSLQMGLDQPEPEPVKPELQLLDKRPEDEEEEGDVGFGSKAAEKAAKKGGSYNLPRAKWKNSEKLTEVYMAVYRDDYDSLVRMMSGDKDLVHARSADGRGPLFWSYEFGRKMMIIYLEKLGANAKAVDTMGKKPPELQAEVMKLLY